MSINAKVTFFFETDDQEGWSESFHVTGASLSAIQSATASVANARCDMLSVNSKLIYGRCSDVTIKGDSLICPPLTLPINGNYTAGTTPLEANTALNVQLFGTALIKNRIFLRGLTADVVEGREYTGISAFDTKFSAWRTAMLAITPVCRHRTSVGPPPVYSYTTAVTTINLELATARKPGRAFGLPVGRRRRR